MPLSESSVDTIIAEMNNQAVIASTIKVFMTASLQNLYKARGSVQIHTVQYTSITHNTVIIFVDTFIVTPFC